MLNKNNLFTLTIILLVILSIMGLIIAINLQFVDLNQGKNNIEINQSMFVSKLVLNYPEIESVSFYDDINDKSVGYVNAFGGIGEDFLIIPGRTYEISSSKNFTINLREE